MAWAVPTSGYRSHHGDAGPPINSFAANEYHWKRIILSVTKGPAVWFVPRARCRVSSPLLTNKSAFALSLTYWNSRTVRVFCRCRYIGRTWAPSRASCRHNGQLSGRSLRAPTRTHYSYTLYKYTHCSTPDALNGKCAHKTEQFFRKWKKYCEMLLW